MRANRWCGVALVSLSLVACGDDGDDSTGDGTTGDGTTQEQVSMENPITVSDETLVRDAAHVVVATTTNVDEQDDGSRLVTIRVDRALKGDLTGDVEVLVPAERSMFDDPEGIWFLDGEQPHNPLEDPTRAVPRWIDEEPSIVRALNG